MHFREISFQIVHLARAVKIIASEYLNFIGVEAKDWLKSIVKIIRQLQIKINNFMSCIQRINTALSLYLHKIAL